MVLCGGADHRRATDVDVLDHLGVADAGASRGALEWIEVDADELDELDVLLLRLSQVVGVVAHREEAGVELRVERLDPAVHDLGKPGEVIDRAHVDARRTELLGGAAG